jgi:peptide/nickel transport system substrate-binding protein
MREVRIVQAGVRLGDPHINTDSRDRLALRFSVSDALVRRDDTGAYVPALATGWHCEPDARTWTIQLRDGVVFHDGQPMTADDVVGTLERVSDPEMGGEMATQGVFATYLDGAHYAALDDRTVRIVTAAPLADLLDLLVDIPITRRGFDGTLPNGTGPYRVVDERDGSVTMAAFAEHWGGAPRFDTLHWRAEPDAGRRAALLLAGDADLVTALDTAGSEAIAASSEARVVEADLCLCVAFLFNAFRGPTADPRVRQALNHGADVERIIAEVASGMATRLNGPLSHLHSGADPNLAPFAHDPVRARELLAEAGYEDGLDLTLDVPESLPDEARDLARRLSEDWATIGVRTSVRTFADRLAYAHMVRNKEIDDACCFDSSPLSTYRVLREKLHSGVAGPWWEGYANPEVDALLDRAAATVDDAERQEVYRAAYRLIHADAPWLFLYSPRTSFGVGPRLMDWRPGFNGHVAMG